MPPMRVKLLYFAVLRDIIGDRQATVTLAEGTRAGEVWESLRREHDRLRDAKPPMIAINESYADPATELHEGDELAFIPPVAGG